MIALLDPILIMLFVIPGWLVSRVVMHRPSPLIAVSSTLLSAVTVVPITVFTACLLTRSYVNIGWVLGTSVTVSILAILRLWFVERENLWKRCFAMSAYRPGEKTALVVAVAIFGAFLINYDRAHFEYGCINGVVMQAITPEAAGAFDPHSGEEHQDWGSPEQRDEAKGMGLIDVHGTGQRLGTTAVIAPWVAVFQTWGFRLVYCLLPMMGFLFGYRLLRALDIHWRVAILAAALSFFNPYVLKIVILDENVMAFCFLIAGLALILENGCAYLAGVAVGAALGIRHIDVFFVPAALLIIGLKPKRTVIFLTMTLLAALPCLLHHHATYGSVFSHEHFVDEVFQATEHNFWGITFDYMGLLNYPFAEQIIRTPYNPFPTFAYYPLNVIAHLGTILSAIVLLGLWHFRKSHPRILMYLGLWLLPQYVLMGTLENWMDPNKMGVIICLFPVLTIGMGAGLQWLISPRSYFSPKPQISGLRRIVWVGLTTLVVSAGVMMTNHWHVPDDNRFYMKYPNVRVERPEYFAFERSLVTSGNPLPSLYLAQQYSPMDPIDRLLSVFRDCIDRDFRRPAPPIMDNDAPVVPVTLDLSRPLVGTLNFIQKGNGAPEVDAVGAQTAWHITGLGSWDAKTLNARIIRTGTKEVSLYLSFGKDGFADVTSQKQFTVQERQHPRMQTKALKGAKMTLILREGDRLRIRETVSLDEVLVYMWEITTKNQDIVVSPPRKMFHN